MWAFIASIITALFSWWRGRDKLREVEANEVKIAEKQADIIANHTNDAVDRLREGDF